MASARTRCVDGCPLRYSSLQALVSSGRDTGELSPPTALGVAAGGGRAFSPGHLPMAVLPQSLAEEMTRVTALKGDRAASGDTCSSVVVDNGVYAEKTGADSETNGVMCGAGADGATVDVAEMMLSQGVLAILVDVIAPRLTPARGEGGEMSATSETLAPPPTAESREVNRTESSRLEALEATVSLLERRPQAQAEFVRLGGYVRISRLIHDMASNERQVPPAPAVSTDPTDRSRSGSKSRTNSLPPGGERSCSGSLRALDAAFDAVFRLAFDGHDVVQDARADGADAVMTLLILTARSPFVAVALRAARSLQALLRVRPMNAVALERHDALRIVADAIADLAFAAGREACVSGVLGGRDAEFGIGAEEAALGRLRWSLNDKREVLSSFNDVVRVMAAVYSRQDARALERYAGILLSASTARFGVGAWAKLGKRCSSCGAAPAPTSSGSRVRRCLVEGCRGARGLCGACDLSLHPQMNEDSHVRVPIAAREREQPGYCASVAPHRADPGWAVEAGRALMKAMAVMLDDRESFGLPPDPATPSADVGEGGGIVGERALPSPASSVLAVMLCIAQDELLEPLQARRDYGVDSDGSVGAKQSPVEHSPARNEHVGDRATAARAAQAQAACVTNWTGGWLLGALEIVARVVVRGDSATAGELGAAGGWQLLAHITCLPSPPRHMCAAAPRSSVVNAGVDGKRVDEEEEEEGVRASSSVEGTPGADWDERLSEAWVGWVGARRLSLWILREALLTGTAGAGTRQGRGCSSGATALVQPAKWLVWLVRTVVKSAAPREGDRGAFSDSEVSLLSSSFFY